MRESDMVNWVKTRMCNKVAVRYLLSLNEYKQVNQVRKLMDNTKRIKQEIDQMNK